jgi:oligoribonuclease NrnB/cAMP/cGMP phosphodiesterase (DHH superfamily)
MFHRTDFDGKCAGAIVKYKFPECRLYGIDYADKFDLEKIEPNEEVIMVDFTLEKLGDMESLYEHCGEFTWIDHHKTCKPIEERLAKRGMINVKGIRQVTINTKDPNGEKSEFRISASELTWQHFYPDRKIPLSVYLLGRYDIWDKSNTDIWENKILPFQYGMRLYSAHPEDQEFWIPHFKTDEHSQIVTDMIFKGKTVLEYDKQFSARVAKLWFPIEFKGLKFQAINRSHGNSLSAESIWDPENYDAVMYFCKGPNTWRITMFTDKEGIDLYPLAKSLGGGGHSQACGFTADNIMKTIPQLIEF